MALLSCLMIRNQTNKPERNGHRICVLSIDTHSITSIEPFVVGGQTCSFLTIGQRVNSGSSPKGLLFVKQNKQIHNWE